MVSLSIQGFGKKFSKHAHFDLVKKWKPKKYPSLDIFLPVCGEDITIIKNTWIGVKSIKNSYKGKVYVYALDDEDSLEVKKLANKFRFNYLVRNNRGHFKKAGNLRHGFINSRSKFIAIFDADFRPRADFVDEIIPYFYKDKKLGIVQTPQYFDVHKKQNWVERGAGAVQEYFYRSVQQNRQSSNGAICVGSNAIYRRKALATNGGTTLIEHSEDVHTGFDLRKNGYDLLYLPVILAKGVCPNDLFSFFKQQYRWCMGSMSLLGSKKFWHTKIPFMSRICYISGFLYYIYTGLATTFILPLVPLALIYIVPEQAKISNYLILIPTFIYSIIIFPLWHKSKYGLETASIKLVYSWAHLFAMVDSIRRSGMEWSPTGSASTKSIHFDLFKGIFTLYGMTSSILWVGGAFYYMIYKDVFDFAPIFISGLFYLIMVSRVVITAFGIEDIKNRKIKKNIIRNKYSHYFDSFFLT